MADTHRQTPTELRTLADILDALDDGQASVRASQALRELLDRCTNHAVDNGSGKGVFTLTLEVNVTRQGKTDVAYGVKTKVPEAPKSKCVMFVGEGGVMHTSDPRQRRLPLHDIARSPAAHPVKE